MTYYFVTMETNDLAAAVHLSVTLIVFPWSGIFQDRKARMHFDGDGYRIYVFGSFIKSRSYVLNMEISRDPFY